jgi:glucan biosynthesis protein C
MSNQPIAPNPAGDRSCVLDYLRAAIIVWVVFLHAILAYPTWGSFKATHYVGSTAPIIDPQKSAAFDLVPVLLNGFFMALMFFISGLFVWKSLTKKGAASFLKDRWKRLGIPYVLALAVIMPLAYYPSFLQTGAEEDFLSYWCGWSWSSGPAWFLSMLLGLNLLAALAFSLVGPSRNAVPAVFVTQPSGFFIALVTLSALGLMPMLALFGPFAWLHRYPVVIGQASRPLFYAVYFFAGVAVGARGLETTFLRHPGPLSRRWSVWVVAAIFAGLLLVVTLVSVKIDPTVPWARPAGWLFLGSSTVLYSATMSMAVLAVFLRFVHGRRAWAESLSDNAYGIYLVHYPFVVWSQYALLGSSMPAIAKALVVFGVSLGLSWGTSALLRSRPLIRAVV